MHPSPKSRDLSRPGDQKWRKHILGDFETKKQNGGGVGRKDLPAEQRPLLTRTSPACYWAAVEDSVRRLGAMSHRLWGGGGVDSRCPSRTSPAALWSRPQH